MCGKAGGTAVRQTPVSFPNLCRRSTTRRMRGVSNLTAGGLCDALWDLSCLLLLFCETYVHCWSSPEPTWMLVVCAMQAASKINSVHSPSPTLFAVLSKFGNMVIETPKLSLNWPGLGVNDQCSAVIWRFYFLGFEFCVALETIMPFLYFVKLCQKQTFWLGLNSVKQILWVSFNSVE